MAYTDRKPAPWHSAGRPSGSLSPGACVAPFAVLHAEGKAGRVQFRLQRTAGGLYVEREDIPRSGLRTVQSLAFSNAADFERWCDDDAIRFEHPLLHAQLKRTSGELWQSAADGSNEGSGAGHLG